MAQIGKVLTRMRLLLAGGIALLAGLWLVSCHKAQPAPSPPQSTSPQLRILCSVFPVFQFTRNITEGRSGVSVELMLPSTLGCPHDYLITPQDMEKIAQAGALVINGLGLEEFLGPTLKRANAGIRVIDASAGVAPLGANPHLFASPRAAATMAHNIAEGLAEADPLGAAAYRANSARYAERLNRLADALADEVKALTARRIVTTHEVFDYLARDSGLQIVAVIEETPGQAPSAAEMIDLVARIKKSGAAAVFTEPQYPAAVGRTLAREAGVPVAELDPVASGPVDAPLDYYETAMRRNIEVLKRTLGSK